MEISDLKYFEVDVSYGLTYLKQEKFYYFMTVYGTPEYQIELINMLNEYVDLNLKFKDREEFYDNAVLSAILNKADETLEVRLRWMLSPLSIAIVPLLHLDLKSLSKIDPDLKFYILSGLYHDGEELLYLKNNYSEEEKIKIVDIYYKDDFSLCRDRKCNERILSILDDEDIKSAYRLKCELLRGI